MSQRLRTLLGLSLLIGASLACSIGGDAVPAPTVEPAAVPTTPTNDPPTKVQIAAPTAMPTGADEALPTGTATPTLTLTPTTTVLTPTHTSKPRSATATRKPVSTEPLTIDYKAVGIKRSSDDQAVLTLKVVATGGAGGYTYYHDNQKQAGAIFEVPGSCGRPFTHTLKVTSADGQTATLPYQEKGLCPSSTPES
jgi:hypothetical protein